jgi:DNA-binding PadR family transcriptional regulator
MTTADTSLNQGGGTPDSLGVRIRPEAGSPSRLLSSWGLARSARFAEPALLILISLADGPKHGYAITEDITHFADVRFGPGSLYGAIARLESRGLIEALEAEDQRNSYQVTAIGEKALRARLASMQSVAGVGQRRLATA